MVIILWERRSITAIVRVRVKVAIWLGDSNLRIVFVVLECLPNDHAASLVWCGKNCCSEFRGERLFHIVQCSLHWNSVLVFACQFRCDDVSSHFSIIWTLLSGRPDKGHEIESGCSAIRDHLFFIQACSICFYLTQYRRRKKITS